MPEKTAPALNHSHWGTFEPVVVDGRVTEARPFARDPDPSPMLPSIADALHHHSRIAQPAVRAGWLDNGPGGARDRRGADRYVAVSWERALDLIADEIKRVIRDRGNDAIYAGSYGWGSAGRFHHARTQLQRFLGGVGGFTGARDTYSNAAGAVLVKNVLGSLQAMNGPGTSWKSIADHADLVVMFGGMPTRNTQVTPGGVGEHTTRGWLEQVKAAGVEFCNISPMRDDAASFLDAEWIAPRPHSDTALMLALSHTLIVEGLHDADFLARYCAGFNRFRDYLSRCRGRCREIRRLGRRLERNIGRQNSRTGAQDGRVAHLHQRQLVAAARRSWRAADLGGDRAGRDTRPGRSAGRRFRLWLRQHGRPREPAAGYADSDAVARPQPGSQLHPGRSHRRPASQPGPTVPVQRAGPHLSRYRSRLLVRRQSVSPSSGHQSSHPRVAPPLDRSSSTIRGGPRPRVMPTSCCQRRRRSSATTSAPARAIDLSSR